MRQLVVEIPDAITPEQLKDLAASLSDIREEWGFEDREVGLFPMPWPELDTIKNFEEALKAAAGKL